MDGEMGLEWEREGGSSRSAQKGKGRGAENEAEGEWPQEGAEGAKKNRKGVGVERGVSAERDALLGVRMSLAFTMGAMLGGARGRSGNASYCRARLKLRATDGVYAHSLFPG